MAVEIRDKATQRAVENVAAKLRRRQVQGSREAALETVLLLRQVVAAARFSSIEQLLSLVRAVGRRLTESQPKESSVGNIVRRVLKLIRDEHAAAAPSTGPSGLPSGVSTPVYGSVPLPGQAAGRPPMFDRASSLYISSSSVANLVLLGHQHLQHSLMSFPDRSGSVTPTTPAIERAALPDDSKKALTIKPALIDAIQEVIDELETVYENVAKNARDHIHSDEIVLTIGKSRTVESFLKAAARDRKFTVIVAETAPSYSGREMADSLSSAGISTVLVPDSCIFALMSRVNKVIIGAHAIMANGGAIAVAGALLAALAARAHATPLVVCTGQFKLTPRWNLHQKYSAVDIGDPERVLNSAETDLPDDVDVVNPWYDYVPPELVNVLITNYGDHPPAFVYRLVKETYDDEDTEL